METAGFRESHLGSTPIRDLGLAVAGTRLEPIVAAFQEELRQAGFAALKPRFYLSSEWGVPFGTVAIAIPFYLARPELAQLHAERTGMVEGFEPDDLLRYLRHEMGHVVNYAYRLYERPEWVALFGAITQPYLEEYRPQPFSRRYVRHLPGWYAQKHPDEDWAETFAVWLTPGCDWRREYAERPTARAKLELCERLMREVATQPPLPISDELDEDVSELSMSLDDFYRGLQPGAHELPLGLDGALALIFDGKGNERAGVLLKKLSSRLATEVYRWTGHFPEHTRRLIDLLQQRAASLSYAASDEPRVTVALTTLITALAMNHVHHGRYLP
jgi:hypothetical protein